MRLNSQSHVVGTVTILLVPTDLSSPKPVHNPCNVRLTDLSSGQCPFLPVRFAYRVSLSIPAVHYKLDSGLCINLPESSFQLNILIIR